MADKLASLETMKRDVKEEFDGTNWKDFAFSVRTTLRGHGCWHTVEPGIPPEDNASAAAKADWTMRNDRAFGVIALSCAKKIRNGLHKIELAKDAFELLRKEYLSKSVAAILDLKHQRDELLKKHKEPIRDWICELEDLNDRLEDAGSSLPEKERCLQLLQHLPHRFRHFVRSNRRAENWEELRIDILEEDRALKREEEQDALARRETAFAAFSKSAASRSGNKNAPRGNKPGGAKDPQTDEHFPYKCWDCAQTGHKQKDCPFTSKFEEFRKTLKTTGPRDFAAAATESTSGPPQIPPADFGSGHFDFALRASNGRIDKDDYILDTGSTRHVVSDPSALTEYRPAPDGASIQCANGAQMEVMGYGNLLVATPEGTRLKLFDVAHCPSVVGNLIGGMRLTANGCTVVCERTEAIVTHKASGRVVLRAPMVSGNWVVTLTAITTDASYALNEGKPDPEAMLWHKRLGHVNIHTLRQMASAGTTQGMPKKLGELGFCSDCAEGKIQHTSHPRRNPEDRAERALAQIHADIFGPVRLQPAAGSDGDKIALNGTRFGLLISDEYTHSIWFKPLASKSEAPNVLMAFHAALATQFPHLPISKARTDGALEFDTHELRAYWARHGVTPQRSPRYSPQSNGVAERSVRTITEMTRAMLIAAGLPAFFWPAAAETATRIKNRLPTASLERSVTPYEALHGRPPKAEKMWTFGCTAWAMVPTHERNGKFDSKAKACIYLGPAFTGASRVWDPIKEKEMVEHSVTIDESTSGAALLKERAHAQGSEGIGGTGAVSSSASPPLSLPVSSPAASQVAQAPVNQYFLAIRQALERNAVPGPARQTMEAFTQGRAVPRQELEEAIRLMRTHAHELSSDTNGGAHQEQVRNESPEGNNGTQGSGAQGAAVSSGTQGDETHQGVVIQDRENGDGNVRRSARLAGIEPSAQELPSGRKRKELGDACFVVLDPSEVPYGDPRSVEEAMKRVDWKEWQAAMARELGSHEERGTWEVVKPPKDANLITAKWVFRVKRNSDGSLQKYKARLVARGFTQVQGIDYEETFAPTSRLQILRLFCSLVAALDMELHQIDFETAYLNATLRHKIYMEPPPGIDLLPGEALLLLLALYGLKQSGHDWHIELRDALKKIGFLQCEFDPTIFVRGGNRPAMLLVYVDDILVATPKDSDVEGVKTELLGLFKGTDLGPAHLCLGIRITRDRESRAIALDQERYADEVLQRFGMEDCRAVKTPMEAKLALRQATEGEPRTDRAKYQAIVGSLAYLAQGTRPDLAFAVSNLGKFNADPSESHMVAAKRVLRYLRGTSAARLTFGGEDTATVTGYVDSDWAADRDDRRSTSGFVFMVNGGAVSWGARKQGAVALSTAEAEYIAAGVAGREALLLRGALTAAGQQVGTITVFCDNQAAIKLVKSPGSHHDRSKHIEIVHHWIREQSQKGTFAFDYIPTDLNPADAFTKSLSYIKHREHAERIGLEFGRKSGEGEEAEHGKEPR